MNLRYCLLFLFVSCIFLGCKDEDDNSYTISVDKTYFEFDNPTAEQMFVLRVYSEGEWEIEYNQESWLSVYKLPNGEGDDVYLFAKKNETGKVFEAEFFIKSPQNNADPVKISVRQLDTLGENILEKIPDEKFKNFLINTYFPSEYATKGDALQISSINCSLLSRVRSLEGIEYFEEVVYLDCSQNLLQSLDISKNKRLDYLDCRSNSLSELDVSHNSDLMSLYCSSNFLKTLDVSRNQKLHTLGCDFNELTSLDLTQNKEIAHFFADNNMFSAKQIKICRTVHEIASLNPEKDDEVYDVID